MDMSVNKARGDNEACTVYDFFRLNTLLRIGMFSNENDPVLMDGQSTVLNDATSCISVLHRLIIFMLMSWCLFSKWVESEWQAKRGCTKIPALTP